MTYYTDAFNQIAEVASRMGVTFQEATEAFRNLAQMGYNIPTMEDVIECDENLSNRIDCLEHKVYALKDDKADCQIMYNTANVDVVKNDLTELQATVRQLRSEMDVLTEKPKRKVDLEIFDQIFDNSDFPFLESDIFPEIDFNIKI